MKLRKCLYQGEGPNRGFLRALLNCDIREGLLTALSETRVPGTAETTSVKYQAPTTPPAAR